MKAIWTVILLFGTAYCHVSTNGTKRCGEIICKLHEFCSDHDHVCRDCSTICEGINKEDKTCDEQCQDYIMDLRYMRRDEYDKLQVISIVSLAFSTIVLLSLIFAGLTFLIYKKYKLSISQINTQVKHKKDSDNLKVDISRMDDVKTLGVDISTIRLPNETTLNMQDIHEIIQNNPRTPQTELTDLPHLTTFKNHHVRAVPDTPTSVYTNKSAPPLNSRHPSEDATLDFAYDNPALTPSPVLDNGGSGMRTGSNS